MNKRKKILLMGCLFALCIGISSIHGYSSDVKADANTSKSTEETTKATYNPVTSITLSQSVLNITKNKKGILSSKVTYGDSKDLKNEPVVWSSKNPSIATVSKDGIVQALTAGKTYIICSSQSGVVKSRCKVVVREPYNPVKSIKTDKTQIRLNKGDKRTLKALVTYGKKTSYTPEAITWSSSNNKIATVTKNGIVKGKSNGTTYIKVKAKYSNKSAKCKVIVQKTKYVAFTFDDGPGIYTNKLLDSLEKNHCQATFFVLGNRVNSYKAELKREYELGMEIGSHTYAHKDLTKLSKSALVSEISKTNKAVKNIIGENPTVLRPPYGSYNKTVSKKAGVPMVYWSVDTLDWKLKNTKKVCNAILKQTKESDIVLLHDIHQTSVDGFIKALPELRDKGFELVTVSELYAIKGKKLKKGVMYFGPKKD